MKASIAEEAIKNAIAGSILDKYARTE